MADKVAPTSQARNPPFRVEDGREDLAVFIHSKLDDYGLSPVEFRVYGRLARRAGAGGARESVRNMAAGCKMGERSVQLALKLLELASLVERIERPGQPAVFKLLPSRRWAHPSKLAALRAQVTSRWKKNEAVRGAPIAPVQPLHPRNGCTPAGATVAPEGSPSEGSPSNSSSPSAPKSACAGAPRREVNIQNLSLIRRPSRRARNVARTNQSLSA